ncbi:hypothetical protein YC2023_002955 [Brassica napus]
MFGLLKKSKPQQDVYFPFKTVFEKEQLIFDKKQFASNEFDFVQKQKKRQNMSDDEKWVRSRDRPFTKAKRSNCDVPEQNELQTYASLEKMLHKAIHVVRQLKRKENNNTSSAPKQQSNFSSLSNSDLKTNVLSSDKSKAVKTTSKALSTRCFKCHRVGHYANKCQKQKPLVTLEKVETEPEKEDPLPIFDDYAHEPKEGSGGEQNCDHKEGSSSIHKPDRTQGEQHSDYGSFAYNPFPFNVSDLRTNLFEEEGNDVPQSMDHYMEPAQHGVQDVLNISTEVHVFHRSRLDKNHARLDLGRARLSLGGEETKDGYAFSSGGPSGQSRKRPYLYPVHPSGSDESGHLDWSSPFSVNLRKDHCRTLETERPENDETSLSVGRFLIVPADSVFWLDRTRSFRISPNPGTKSVKENATKQPAFANPEMVFVRKQCCNVKSKTTLGNGYLGSRIDEERSEMRYLV